MVSPPFEYFIMAMIALNTVVLMMKVRGPRSGWGAKGGPQGLPVPISMGACWSWVPLGSVGREGDSGRGIGVRAPTVLWPAV